MMVYQIEDRLGTPRRIYGNGTRYYVDKNQAVKVKDRVNNSLKTQEYSVVEYQLVPTGEVF